jgi:Acetyltransferases
MDVSIIALEENDAEKVLALFSLERNNTTGIDDSWSLDDLKRLFNSKSDYNYGLSLNGEIIGFVLSHINEASRKVYLENILIAKEYRKQGLGKKLLNHLLTKYAKMGIFRFVAQVNPENIAALEVLKTSEFIIGEKMYWVQKNDFDKK